MSGSTTIHRHALLASVGVLGLAGAAGAQAPQGGVVVRGQAEIRQGGTVTTIRQGSERAVIDWRGFDVGRDNVVRFEQPGARSATLNRIANGRESVIAGQVTAPGTIIIQNHHGVLFTGTARVDVGGMVATTQRVDAERFQRDGALAIRGGEAPGARVRNEGRITVRDAGLTALVGGRVENTGTIVARRGSVALASGEVTTIDLAGDGLIRIATEGAAARPDAGVRHDGLIEAPGGHVLMSAGAAARIVESAINVSGVVRADAAAGDGGRIDLLGRGEAGVTVSGRLDASGARGGAITVTGRQVRVEGAARLAARGTDRGGTVRVGGDWQGSGALRRSATTTVAPGGVIDAGSAAGRGGTVVVWADGATRMDGTIIAAGPAGGGRVETSGLELLGIGATASVEAGPGGEWLLDPRNVVIQTGGANTPTDGIINPGAAGTGAYSVNAPSLVAALNAGTNVSITTVQDAFTQAGDITVNSTLNITGNGSLTLRADRNIAVNTNVTLGGTGSLLFTALTGNITIGAGSGNRTVSAASGNVTLAAPQGSVLIGRTNNAPNNTQIFSASGTLSITAGQDIRLIGGSGGGSWVRLGNTGRSGAVEMAAANITLRGGTGGNSFIEIASGAGGAITLAATGTVDLIAGTPADARVSINALSGATLTMSAPTQSWGGLVRSEAGGGTTRLAGAITATVAPRFDLAAGAGFSLGGVPGFTAATSLTAPGVDIAVTTRGTGTIDLGGPLSAARVQLVSEERVRLAAGAVVTGTGPGDAVVIAAGRSFTNEAGTDAILTQAAGARFLVYVDPLDGVSGAYPATTGPELYGRSFLAAPPASFAGVAGSRVVFGARPTLTLTGETLQRFYGEAAALGFTAIGLRPRDSLATALVAAPVVTSPGAAVGADVGSYAVQVTATASDQGYLLVTNDGVLTVTPAPLSVIADDATRRAGEPNPPFTARFAGFRLGQDASVLAGTLVLTTSATVASPTGSYAITPSGLIASNYALTFVDGMLTVTPAPVVPPATPPAVTPPPAATPGAGVVTLEQSRREFLRGSDPVTFGDATFRTTSTEAGLAPRLGGAEGFTLGSVVFAVPLAAAEGQAAGCDGPVNLGSEACGEVTRPEAFRATGP